MQRVTVRVELGNHVLRGRQIESLEVAQAVGDHARCRFAFDRDPRVPGSVKDLRLGDLADARVRVVFLVDADDGAGADGTECLAFEGQVRHADARYQPTGVARFAVTALSASYALAEHVDRAYRREHTIGQLVVALGAHVAGDLPTGPARDYVQPGRSAWATLAEVAAGEGLQLRPAWGRSPDAAAAPTPVEVAAGFADVTHTLVWGRDLLGFNTSVAPANPGVTGAFYDPAAKHDHRYVVRTEPTWLGGAAPVVSAARRAADLDAGGGEPGHVEVGGPGGVRARSLAEFRGRLERESARRLGAAVVASGSSAVPALRAGDKVDLWTSAAAAAGTLDADGRDAAAGDADGAAGPGAWVNGPEDADRTGVFGLVAVTHRWNGGLYENQFTATPWAEYAPRPAAVAADYGAQGGGPTAGGVALAIVVENADPKHQGRVRVRYPWMSDGTRTAWVRVAAPGAGNGRGLGWLPSVGDEVVVAAVAGDPEHPVVLGALWNGVDRAAHHPGRTHLVTPSGNTLALTEGPAGAGRETVELHTAGGKTGVQLSGNGGSPVVTVYSDGDLSLEAPRGQVRITAKSLLTHVAEAHATEVGGAHVLHAAGAVTVEGGAGVTLAAGGELAVRAGGALRAHAGGAHVITGATVALNPAGATAPAVRAGVPAAAATLWGARPVPGPGPGVSTEAPRSRTRREVAQASAAAAVHAGPVAAPVASTRTAAKSAAARMIKALPNGVCGGGWATMNAERQRVLASGGPTENAIQRNGPISAAYAQYYQRNPNNEWAGLAAIVSRQARCAMEHARDSMGPVNYDYYYRQLPEMQKHVPVFPQEPPAPGPVALGAMTAYDGLAKTNKLIFSDIYPVLRFEEEYGAGALRNCADSRPDGPVDPRVMRGVEQMRSDNPDIRRRGGGLLAAYEQKEILQKHVLDDGMMRTVFDANQRLADTTPGYWLGARKPEVALTAGCDDGTPTVPFEGKFIDGDTRVAYYAGRLVPAFENLQPGRLRGIIGQIAGGR